MATLDLAELKKGGFIKERRPDMFAVRLRVPVGTVHGHQLGKLGELAERFGEGFIHITSRQGIEIPGVRFADLELLRQELATVGLAPGSCGPRVRNILACPGNRSCSHSFVDSRGFGETLDRLFVGKDFGTKIKIAVAGCPNSCTTPQVNDIGFVGGVDPVLVPDLCNGCGLCVELCKEGAIAMGDDSLPRKDASKCLYCGDCILLCPTDAWEIGRAGYTAYVGGKVGRHPQLATKFAEFVSPEQGSKLVGGIVEFTIAKGKKGERLGSLLNRVGVAALHEYVAVAS